MNLLDVLSEEASFLGAAPREVLRVEVQHNVSLPLLVAQTEPDSGVQPELKVGGAITNV